MQIAKKYKIEKIAASPKLKTPLAHIVVRNHQAIATNGAAIAVVPCALSSKDVEGPLTQEALAYSRKHTLGDKCASLTLASDDHLVCEDTTEFPRSYSSYLDPQGTLFREPPPTFPDALDMIPRHHADDIILALDPSLLKALAEALGSNERIVLHLPPPDPDNHIFDPIRVSGMDSGEYGCIVPLH